MNRKNESTENREIKRTSVVLSAVISFLGAMAFGANFWMVHFVVALGALFGLAIAIWALRVTGRMR